MPFVLYPFGGDIETSNISCDVGCQTPRVLFVSK